MYGTFVGQDLARTHPVLVKTWVDYVAKVAARAAARAVARATVRAAARAPSVGVANAAARHVMCVAEAVAHHVALLHLVPKRDVLCSNDRGAHIGFTWCFIHFLLDRKCPASRGFSSLSMQIR